MSDGNQLPPAGETACPTFQQGGAGGFACRSNGHNPWSASKMNKFPKTVKHPSPTLRQPATNNQWYNLYGFVDPGAHMTLTKRLTLFAAVTAVSLLAAELSKSFTPQQRRWWAFQKVVKPAVPTPAARAWVANDIDAFVLAKLEEKNLKPAPPADKVTLIRRATLDLTGLLPTPEEVQAFDSDTSPDAFAKVVDRLLASPRYGE